MTSRIIIVDATMPTAMLASLPWTAQCVDVVGYGAGYMSVYAHEERWTLLASQYLYAPLSETLWRKYDDLARI